jgi:hypothetical protein
MIFAFYRVLLTARPDQLLRGPGFAHLRKLRRKAAEDGAAAPQYREELRRRLDDWHRKRLYDGLDSVFLAFCQHARVEAPAAYTKTTVVTWSKSIAGISLIRNLLMHGVETVTPELEAFTKEPYSLGFEFKNNEPLRLTLFHLQMLEAFIDQLLTALNISLVELARPSLKDAVKEQLGKEGPLNPTNP